jgi:S-adenosylmethionine/arginine decarboxylase-like enzyme
MNWFKLATKLIRHKHLIVRAEVESLPTTEEAMEGFVNELADKIGMTVIEGPHAKYVTTEGNRGWTVMAIIETSHISCHTWDEVNPHLVQLDVYSCKNFSPQKVFDHLKQWKPKKVSYKFLDREHGLHQVNKRWFWKS